MYITKIHAAFDGDTFFPEIDDDAWCEISVEQGIQDDDNPYTYFFHVYEKIQ
jgi:dihydrofolate reductase